MSTYWQCVVFQFVAISIHYLDGRNQLTVAVFRNHFILETSLLINLHLVGSTLDDVLVSNLTRCLSNDHSVVWIPLNDFVAFLKLRTVFHFQDTTVRNVVGHYCTTSLHIDQTHLSSTANYDVLTVLAFYCTNIL